MDLRLRRHQPDPEQDRERGGAQGHHSLASTQARTEASAAGLDFPAPNRVVAAHTLVFWIDGAAPGTPTQATIRLRGLVGAAPTEWFERVPLVPAATEWAMDNEGGYALSGDPDWDDTNPGDPRNFGRAQQTWSATVRTVVRGSWDDLHEEPGADVDVQILRTVQDNFGIVAWLCDTADVAVSSVTMPT